MIIVVNIFSILLTLVYFFLIRYFYKGWKSISAFKSEKIQQEYSTSVSVLVPVRNESANILQLIQDLINQDYPKHLFEIVIIDDHSTDNTAELVSHSKSDNVKLIKLSEDKPLNSYKKKAISIAIAQSQAELIITTDGDCRVGSSWISTMVNFYCSQKLKFISAPVCFTNEQSWFEKIQTIEFQYLIGVGAASIQNKIPSTCNGANLAYTRDVFNELGGFDGIDNIASGDDELFLHKVAKAYPHAIGFLKNQRAIVRTHAKSVFKEFVQQRKRWASKSMHYKEKRIVFMVSFIFLFNLSILFNFFMGFFTSCSWNILVYQVVVKSIIDGIFIYSTLSFFNKKRYFIYLPIVEFFHTFYVILIGIYSNLGGKYEWKGRKVN